MVVAARCCVSPAAVRRASCVAVHVTGGDVACSCGGYASRVVESAASPQARLIGRVCGRFVQVR
eukprot:6223309-Prorocentrum_lima.AAC.1